LPVRLLGASGLLLFAVLAMVVVIGYLLRAWRRAVSEPLRPIRLDEHAWARKPLAPRDDHDPESQP
jgi:hypothetical protein